MKLKDIFLAVVTLLVAHTVYAQNDFMESVSIRGGFHSANLVYDGSKPDTTQSLNGFYFGFVKEQKLAEIFYLGTGLEYFQNGIRYSNNSERILHTISIPVDLKLKLGPAFGLAGAAANFKVAEKFALGNNNYNPADMDKSNWFDIPVFLGAGVKILFVTIEARYHWGLFEVRNGLKSEYFQLGAALTF